MGIINIARVHNASSIAARVINRENPPNTGGATGIVLGPGETHSGDMFVPWCHDGGDFDTKHIDVTVGNRTFKIWQAAQSDGDRVRATSDTWQNPGIPIGGFAAVGPVETEILGDVRVLVIHNASLWLLPGVLMDCLNELALTVARDGFQVCNDRDPRTKETPPIAVPSNPKLTATAFSMAGIVSDLFDDGSPNPQLQYRDSGKRYEFTIAQGVVIVRPPPRSAPSVSDPSREVAALTEAVSYNRLRRGEPIPLPHLDLIAANGGRVFAKEEGVDRFYFAVIDHEFVHGTTMRRPFTVPTTYFKLDPEFNQRPPEFNPGANLSDLTAHLDGDFSGHPAVVRFPLFRFLFGLKVAAAMTVNVKRGAWHLIDARPTLANSFIPADAMFSKLVAFVSAAKDKVHNMPGALVALDHLLDWLDSQHHWVPQFLDDRPPDGTGYDHVAYCRTPGAPPVWQQSIGFTRVLDVGVGHVHYHQQYERITGGEIQMLRAPSDPNWFFDHLKVYQFLNGPVRDPDGFNDGTCNYYLLVALKDGGPFGLLYLDEQSLFSPRWRFADPRDSNGSVVTLAADLAMNPVRYAWNKNTFWSPFGDPGSIGARSRLAVSAQVVLVSGDPDPLIFSINFSWGTMDRTWRWRPLPVPVTGVRYFPDPVDGSEVVMPDSGDTVYPQSIRLRDDMTIHLKGTRKSQEGHWYQRYLPASNELVGAPSGARPMIGYSHPWKFLPDDVFRFADGFSHFGVYDRVDSRTQYYPVDPASFAVLEAANVAPDDWWVDDSGQLFITAYTFRIDTLRLPWPPFPPPPTSPLQPSSLYNTEVLLRFVKRGSRWIALHADKRDDDMELFDTLPASLTLKRRGLDGTARPGTIKITLQSGVRIEGPPAVQTAYFWWADASTAAIAFRPELAGTGDNVWRIRMAAFNLNGAVVQLLDLTLDAGFQYNVAAGVYQHRWVPSAAAAAQLRAYATDDGANLHGTSIWFEDMTGHVAPSEQAIWKRPREMRVTVDPAKIPLGLLVPVTVHALDAFTSATLEGSVSIEEVTDSRKTNQQFTYTFSPIQEDPVGGGPNHSPKTKTRLPAGMVTVDQYPDTPIPFVFYKPTLTIHVISAPVPAGRPVQIPVDVRDTETNQLVKASLAIAGQNAGLANSPVVSPILSHTFAVGIVTVTVSAAGYPDASFSVSAYAPSLRVTVDPSSPGLGKAIKITVHAVDTTLGTVPSTGCRVWIDGKDIESTDKQFTYTFRARKVGPPTNPSSVFPTGTVRALGYPDTAINFGFDTAA